MRLSIVKGIDVVVQAIVIPVGAALLQPSIARLGPLHVLAVEDDVVELEASRPEAMTTSTVVVHSMWLVEVVPRPDQFDCPDFWRSAEQESDEGGGVHGC